MKESVAQWLHCLRSLVGPALQQKQSSIKGQLRVPVKFQLTTFYQELPQWKQSYCIKCDCASLCMLPWCRSICLMSYCTTKCKFCHRPYRIHHHHCFMKTSGSCFPSTKDRNLLELNPAEQLWDSPSLQSQLICFVSSFCIILNWLN